MQYDRIMPDRTVVTHPTSPWLQNETTESPLDHQLYFIVLSDIPFVTLPKAQHTLCKEGRQTALQQNEILRISHDLYGIKRSKHAFRLSKNML